MESRLFLLVGQRSLCEELAKFLMIEEHCDLGSADPPLDYNVEMVLLLESIFRGIFCSAV